MLISFRKISIQSCFSTLHANIVTIHADFNSIKRKSIILSKNKALSDYLLEGTRMQTKPDYSDIVQSDKFKALMVSKKRFLRPRIVFFLVFYFSLPVLTSYTKVLNHNAFGFINWAWIFAFAQFIMTWALSIIYSRQSVKFDQMVEEIKKEKGGKRG